MLFSFAQFENLVADLLYDVRDVLFVTSFVAAMKIIGFYRYLIFVTQNQA